MRMYTAAICRDAGLTFIMVKNSGENNRKSSPNTNPSRALAAIATLAMRSTRWRLCMPMAWLMHTMLPVATAVAIISRMLMYWVEMLTALTMLSEIRLRKATLTMLTVVRMTISPNMAGAKCRRPISSGVNPREDRDANSDCFIPVGRDHSASKVSSTGCSPWTDTSTWRVPFCRGACTTA